MGSYRVAEALPDLNPHRAHILEVNRVCYRLEEPPQPGSNVTEGLQNPIPSSDPASSFRTGLWSTGVVTVLILLHAHSVARPFLQSSVPLAYHTPHFQLAFTAISHRR